LRRQFLQDGDLPFTNVLTDSCIAEALNENDVSWRDRVFSPLVTLWVFLGQTLSADHSCRAAVSRLIAHRVSRGQSPCSAETGGYCQARKRLPEKFFSDVARQTGRAIVEAADATWRWKGRRVLMFDGTTVSMPDTIDNQNEYPQNVAQKPGLGFPIARVAALFSLSCGAVLDLRICKYAGKGQSELSLLRKLMGVFRPGDILLTDRLMCSWREMAMLKSRGVESVTRLSSKRTVDFRRGKRIGKDDHIVKWPKPRLRPTDPVTDSELPDFLEVRETRVRVEQAGFRTVCVIIVTTLLNANEITKDELADLYRQRWSNELDLRSLKETMQLHELRCKTPDLVRKEIWTHVLAYNLIRAAIAQAAVKHSIEPRSISFKGAMQTIEAFRPLVAIQGQQNAKVRSAIYSQILDALVVHRVGDRPDRFEPRRRKRRNDRYDLLTKSRDVMKREIQKQLRRN
jgi:hypothetical protein